MRSRFGTTAALVLAGALGAGCDEMLAQEAPKGAAVPAPAPQAAPTEAAPNAVPADEPHGTRPIDDGAIRALAEEVARLRAELARLKDVNPAAQGTPVPQEPPAVADAAARPGATPPSVAGPASAQEPAPAAAEPASAATAETPLEREPPVVVEREVPVYVDREVVVEREVPVYVDREIVVESPTVVVEEIVVEQVVYRDTVCYQSIPCGHVHSIGCGHHYYGCACHPWYYSLDGGFDIQFVFVDRDEHGHWKPRPRRPYAHGYRDGYRDGARDVPRAPARPVREIPAALPPREHGPSAPVHRGDGERERPFADRPFADRPVAGDPSVRTDRPSGDVGAGARVPRDSGSRSPEAQRGPDVGPAGPFERPGAVSREGSRDVPRPSFPGRTPDVRTDRSPDRPAVPETRTGPRTAVGLSPFPERRTDDVPDRRDDRGIDRGHDRRDDRAPRHRAPGEPIGAGIRAEPEPAVPVTVPSPAPRTERARDREDPPRRRTDDRPEARPDRRPEPPVQRPPLVRTPEPRAPNRPDQPDRRRHRRPDGEE